MAKNILLAVDAEHYASAATQLARELCHDPADRIIIVHVHEFAVGRFGRLQVDCMEGEAERLVTTIKSELKDAGIHADAEIRETHIGHVARVIIEVADQYDATVIVLGSSRPTDLPHLPFGSVANKVLHLARRPVLVVPSHAEAVRVAPEATESVVLAGELG